MLRFKEKCHLEYKISPCSALNTAMVNGSFILGGVQSLFVSYHCWHFSAELFSAFKPDLELVYLVAYKASCSFNVKAIDLPRKDKETQHRLLQRSALEQPGKVGKGCFVLPL